MDNTTFASYKFKPSDVIEGLNRYFADAKANRYRRVPLEIRNGVWTSDPDYRKDIVFTNSYSDASVTTKASERGWKYYLICDPEEVVGVAINWLREEHDIFYTPGMEVPVEDFDVDEAAREYEKETRTSDIFCEENLDAVPVAKVRDALGIAEDSDIFQCIKYRNHQLETLRTELAESRRMYHNAIKERNQFGKRLADIRKAAGMAVGDPSDLVKYVETLREKAEENSVLRGNLDYFADIAQGRQKALSNLHDDILKVYREIFDCSNGDPEGADEETLHDILTEYQRVLKLKDAAEEKAIKYKELARENEEKAAKYKVRLDNAERQLRWTEEVSSERLKKYEELVKEREKVKSLEQKLSEIKDICER